MRKIPLPCDLPVGFMIHVLEPLAWLRLNSSAKSTYSDGRMYVWGKKLYLDREMGTLWLNWFCLTFQGFFCVF